MVRLISRLLMPWVRFDLRPTEVAATLGEVSVPIVYVLAKTSTLDERVLQRACARAHLPRPQRRLLLPSGSNRVPAVMALSRRVGLWRSRQDRRPPPALLQLLQALRADPSFDVMLVPVNVYWGRAPQRESGSWWHLLVSEDWALSGRMARVMRVLLNGRNTRVEFGEAASLRAALSNDVPEQSAARRVARNLSGQLAAARTAHLGPDLSHQRTLMLQVLRARAVRVQVALEARDHKKLSRRKLLEQASGLFQEIAANYSPPFVHWMERVLRWLWTRIYDGVDVVHGQTLTEIAAGHELIYVPCHRSTMDDLLMPYAIYTQGLAVPHIAAGLNLNLPVVGTFMRKGGAFFMRRSFKGQPLYAVVFMTYLGALMARGHSLQYFIEGGRSRSGRMLQPKTGMLSITIRSFMKQPLRPVMFVPVYLGYERIMEVDSYMGELAGRSKEKESIWGFLRSLRRLRENFGRVSVNFGEPIPLGPLLEKHQPDWRESAAQSERPTVASALVDTLADDILRNINSAATMNPVNLLALVFLATPRQVLVAGDLKRQLVLIQSLLARAPYGPRVSVTRDDPEAIIAKGVKLGLIKLLEGELWGLDEKQAATMPYYRNNVLHLLAIPSLLACCFHSNSVLPEEDLQRLAWRIYPYVSQELFLRWTEQQLAEVVSRNLAALRDCGVLTHRAASGQWCAPPADTAAAMQLSLLAQPMVQTIERYYLAIALLRKAGSGVLTQSELEQRCQQMAQRMRSLYGFYSPEFHDRSLFEAFLKLLRERGVLRADAAGRLEYDEVLDRVTSDAQLVLSEQIRHSILQLVHA